MLGEGERGGGLYFRRDQAPKVTLIHVSISKALTNTTFRLTVICFIYIQCSIGVEKLVITTFSASENSFQ